MEISTLSPELLDFCSVAVVGVVYDTAAGVYDD